MSNNAPSGPNNYQTQKRIDSKTEVQNFLCDLNEIMTSPNFNIDKDLDILPKKNSEADTDPYTTENTLLDLDYDSYDVKAELLSLTVANYVETMIDNKDSSLPPFYVFTKPINSRDVYIKVKIRDQMNNKVFCVSFHYARYPISTHPYQ